MQTLKDLRAKIQALETERARLMVEVESLRKAAESRVITLEGEVVQMREEAKSLRELLGNSSKEIVSSSNVQKTQVLPSSS